MPPDARREDGFEVFDLAVQQFARVLAQRRGDVVVELSALTMQDHRRHADHGEDETQTLNVLAQFARERVILSWLGGW
jgi:hypothetical protein